MERESGSWSAWGKVLGMTADQDKGNDVAGFDIDTIGVSLGFDNQISTNFALGLGFGINNSDIEFDDGQDTDMDSYNVGLYGTYSTTAFYVDGGLFFAGNDYDSERGTTTSTTDGTEYGAYLGAGYNLVDNKSWYFIPTASVEWAQVDIDGFTEEGGPLNWQIKDYDSSSLVGTLGFRIGSKMTMGRAKVEPEFRLAWAHEFGDTERTSKARLAVGGTSFYSFDGIEAEEDSALFGVGINTYFTENFSLGIDYDGEYNESFQGHSIAAMLRYKF
jgi:outer membrane autotransporter protein